MRALSLSLTLSSACARPIFQRALTHAGAGPGADLLSTSTAIGPFKYVFHDLADRPLLHTHTHTFAVPLCGLLTWTFHNVRLWRVSRQILSCVRTYRRQWKLDLTGSHDGRAVTCVKVTRGIKRGGIKGDTRCASQKRHAHGTARGNGS